MTDVQNNIVPGGLTKKIAVPTPDGYIFIALHEIISCKAMINYTQFRLTGNRMIVSSYTLKHFSCLLDQKGFFRVHKSYLINLLHTTRYIRKGMVIQSDGSEIEVSRTYKNYFLEGIKNNFEFEKEL